MWNKILIISLYFSCAQYFFDLDWKNGFKSFQLNLLGTAEPFSGNRPTLHDKWPKYDDMFYILSKSILCQICPCWLSWSNESFSCAQ